MTIEELKEEVLNLSKELEHIGTEKHNKSASLRIRGTLGRIKNAVPQLRRDLVALDKKK